MPSRRRRRVASPRGDPGPPRLRLGASAAGDDLRNFRRDDKNIQNL